MKDLLLPLLFLAVGLVLPIRYLVYRLRVREAAEAGAEVEWRPPNGHEINGTVGCLLVGVVLLSRALTPGEADLIDVDGATGPCSVADGRSYSEGGERLGLYVTTYADHSAFVGAFSDSLGSAPDSTEDGVLWPIVQSLKGDTPVEIEAEFTTSDYVRRMVELSAEAPDGTDALTPDLRDQLAGIAQGVLTNSPESFGCTAVERYPAP
jgi:hypothetical protein